MTRCTSGTSQPLAGAGVAKFLSSETWSVLFANWGYPAGLSYVVGGVELIAALLILPPRTSRQAAGVLIVVMLGALITVLLHPGRLGPGAPLIHITLLSVIIVLRSRQGSREKRGVLKFWGQQGSAGLTTNDLISLASGVGDH